MANEGAMDSEAHWSTVWGDREPTSVSWFQESPEVSLRSILACEPRPGSVVDVGAGASVLVDRLLEAGVRDVTVVDIAPEAIERVRERLGSRSETVSIEVHDVSFEVHDVCSWRPDRTWDVWHDRAVLHFLTDPADVERYVATAATAVRPGGHAVIGCFAPDGPEQCSGMPTVRRSADELAALFEPWFAEVHREREVHRTPWQADQPFSWVVLRRLRAS